MSIGNLVPIGIAETRSAIYRNWGIPMTEPSLQTLGRYTIRAEIGRGGFATVYQALDASLNREVALKVLHPQMSADRSFVERFRKEARTLASLRHPHIVTVYEVSEVEGRLFIAMELAHGPSLAQADCRS